MSHETPFAADFTGAPGVALKHPRHLHSRKAQCLSNQRLGSFGKQDWSGSDDMDSVCSDSLDSSLRGGDEGLRATLEATQGGPRHGSLPSDHLKEAKRKLNQLRDSEPGGSLRIPWLEFPRAMTASDCGGSPLRMSMTFGRDADDAVVVQHRVSDATWLLDLEHPSKLHVRHSALDSGYTSSANNSSATNVGASSATCEDKASGLGKRDSVHSAEPLLP